MAMAVTTRSRMRNLVPNPVPNPVTNPTNSVILMDIPINTDDIIIFRLFSSVGLPKLTYLNRDSYMDRYTDSCILEFKSPGHVQTILQQSSQSSYMIGDIAVKVTRHPELQEDLDNLVREGQYLMIIRNMKAKNGVEAHNFLRKSFEDLDCADVLICKTNTGHLSGIAEVRFRTSEGRERARILCNSLGLGWVVELA